MRRDWKWQNNGSGRYGNARMHLFNNRLLVKHLMRATHCSKRCLCIHVCNRKLPWLLWREISCRQNIVITMELFLSSWFVRNKAACTSVRKFSIHVTIGCFPSKLDEWGKLARTHFHYLLFFPKESLIDSVLHVMHHAPSFFQDFQSIRLLFDSIFLKTPSPHLHNITRLFPIRVEQSFAQNIIRGGFGLITSRHTPSFIAQNIMLLYRKDICTWKLLHSPRNVVETDKLSNMIGILLTTRHWEEPFSRISFAKNESMF